MNHDTSGRIKRLQSLIKPGIDGILTTDLHNIRYLSGFTGTSALLVISRKKSIFLTDFRYVEQAGREVTGCSIMEYQSPHKAIARACNRLKVKTLGFEAMKTSVAELLAFKKNLKGIKFVPVSGSIEDLRALKDKVEIARIRKGIEIACKGLEMILPRLTAGKTERDISLELEYSLKKNGAERPAFDFIVASGRRSSLPHGVASSKKIGPRDIVTIDFGCSYMGYNTDITRTFILGKPSPRKENIYKLVRKGQEIAFGLIKPGAKCGDIDGAVRDFFSKEGVVKYFGHGLGHGVGLDVHEAPRLAKGVKERLKEGMVITIEPGIYMPGFGGVRLEDMVLVKKGGCEILTKKIFKGFNIES